jgi:hypothetical protein
MILFNYYRFTYLVSYYGDTSTRSTYHFNVWWSGGPTWHYQLMENATNIMTTVGTSGRYRTPDWLNLKRACRNDLRVIMTSGSVLGTATNYSREFQGGKESEPREIILARSDWGSWSGRSGKPSYGVGWACAFFLNENGAQVSRPTCVWRHADFRGKKIVF